MLLRIYLVGNRYEFPEVINTSIIPQERYKMEDQLYIFYGLLCGGKLSVKIACHFLYIKFMLKMEKFLQD